MNFWEFCDKHWLIFLLLSLPMMGLIFFMFASINGLIMKSWSRFLRSRNIKNQGWPPEHLDADGDFKPERKENNE